MASNDETANDEGADPTGDIKKQNPGERVGADAITEGDPHKIEKLSKLGKDDSSAADEAAEGTE